MKISNQLLAGLTQPMNLLGTTAQMGASIGIALLPQHECIASDILTAADHAMYCAKRREKGQVVLADETNTWNMVSTIQNKK